MADSAARIGGASNALARAAEAAGCRVRSRTTMDDGDRTWPVLALECGDNENAIAFLNRAAVLDAGDPEVRDLALRLRKANPRALDFARSVQAFVRSTVRFVREVRETFQHTLYTLRRRAGDCDDHARAVVALARAGGIGATIVGVRNGAGAITHVAPILTDGTRRYWAETTVAAHFGEHPRAAAVRLGLFGKRSDLWAKRRPDQRPPPA